MSFLHKKNITSNQRATNHALVSDYPQAPVTKAAPKAQTNGKTTAAPTVDSDESSSDDDSSEGSDEEPAKGAAKPATKESSDSSESESDEDEVPTPTTTEALPSVNDKKRKNEGANPSPKKSKSDGDGIKSVYIGGLSYNVDNDWLKTEFESCGPIVDARVVMDRNTQKSKG
jgi:nucleolin